MSDNRGGVFLDDRPNSRGPSVAPEAPVSAGDILGAHWTLGRQDFAGAPRVSELDAYKPIVDALASTDDRGALTRLLQPKYTTRPNLFGANDQAGLGIYDPAAIWPDVAKRRAADPAFLKEVPAKNGEEFRAWVKSRELGERRAAQGVVARQQGKGQNTLGFVADVGTGLADPINLMTLPLGGPIAGETKSVVLGVAREALFNAGVETIELPSIAANRADFGETMSATDMAEDVGIAAIGGAAFHAGGKAIGAGAKAAGRAIAGSDAAGAIGRKIAPIALRFADPGKVSDGDVARAFGTDVPADIRTPDEQAALHVLTRQADVDASNPFKATPAGMDVHAEKMTDALDRILTAGSPDAPVVPRETSAIVSRGTAPLRDGASAVDTVIARFGRVENASGGGDVRNARSSATGKYQFTDGTWLRYYKREIGANGQSDAQILAHRADGSTQDRLVRALTQDNAALLHRAGQPESAGNLYLLHFAGPDGLKVLRAAEDTPIETVLGARAIEANPFLKGKTAGDVVSWAHAKMGEAAGARVQIDPAAIGDDVELRAAQQSLDDANMQSALAREDRAAVSSIDPREELAPWKSITAASSAIELKPSADVAPAERVGPVAAIGEDAGRAAAPDIEALADRVLELERAGKSLSPLRVARALNIDQDVAVSVLGLAASRPGSGLRIAASSGRVSRIPRSIAPKDMLRVLAEAGGIRDDEGHALRKGGRVSAQTGKARSGRDMGRVFVPGVGKLISRKGMSIDRAGELLHKRGFFRDRPTTAEVLDMLEQAVTQGKKIYGIHDMPGDAPGDRFDEADIERASQALADYVDDDAMDDALIRDVAALQAQGLDAGDAVTLALDYRLQQTSDIIIDDSGDPSYARLHSDPDDPFGQSVSDRGADEGVDGSEARSDAARGSSADAEAGRWEIDHGADLDEREAAGLAGHVPLDPQAGRALDDPNGPGAAAIADSLDHDVRAELDAGAAVDPAIAQRQRQEAQLKAASPMRGAGDQDSTIGSPLFDAVDQGGFRLDNAGGDRGIEDILKEIDDDMAAIKAARDCL